MIIVASSRRRIVPLLVSAIGSGGSPAASRWSLVKAVGNRSTKPQIGVDKVKDRLICRAGHRPHGGKRLK
jgi:hypothetical protein